MKFKIYYLIDDWQDCIVIDGETIEEVREKTFKELGKRGVDYQKNSCWSEEIN